MSSASVEYARRLYDDILGWYQSAETKAQVVIGIDGAFLAFLTSGIFEKPEDLRQIVAAFSPSTWLLLLLMAISLILSLLSGIYCLWSRIYSEARLQAMIAKSRRPGSGGEVYDAEIMWFFQFVAAVDVDVFRRTLETAGEDLELQAMESQVRILSGNVRRKHQAANLGFLFTALTLVFFSLAGISYASRADDPQTQATSSAARFPWRPGIT
jgi:hypothetical protein